MLNLRKYLLFFIILASSLTIVASAVEIDSTAHFLTDLTNLTITNAGTSNFTSITVNSDNIVFAEADYKDYTLSFTAASAVLSYSITITNDNGTAESVNSEADGTKTLNYTVDSAATANFTVTTAEIVTRTISCPVGYCYLTLNATNTTLQGLDDLQSNDTIQGYYDQNAQKSVLHRTGYMFNQNQSVSQGWGYFYYFTKATDVNITVTSASLTLQTGWNLVGNMNANARTLGELKTSIGANVVTAQYYNRTSGAWDFSNSTYVPAMEAFYVRVSNSTVWSG